MITDELRKAIADYFDAGDFAEYIGVTVEQIMDAFPEELDEALGEICELLRLDVENEDDYSEERE